MQTLIGILAVVGFFVFYYKKAWKPVYGKPTSAQATPLPEPIFKRCNNGWVVVNKTALKLTLQEYEALLADKGMRLPWITRRMLYPLPIKDRIQLTTASDPFSHLEEGEIKEQWKEDAKRGLTIGSALFGYAIPESFILLDDCTRFFCELHLHLVKERHTFDEWMDETTVSKNPYRQQIWNIGTVFEQEHEFNLSDCLTYYQQHEDVLSKFLLVALNRYSVLPDINATLCILMSSFKQDPGNDAECHYFMVALTVAIRKFYIRIPYDWLMDTPMSRQLYDAVMNKSVTIQPSIRNNHLSLVVNNAKEQA